MVDTHPSLKNLADKEVLQDRVLLVKDKVYGMGKNGRPFLSLLVGDKTGHLDARVWDQVESLNSIFEIGDLIKIKGAIQIYNNKRQLVIHKLENVSHLELDRKDFAIEEKKIDSHALFADLVQILNTIESQYIRQLCVEAIHEESVKGLLLASPAAKTIHHAERGGLLDHVVSICQLMQGIASHYKQLNRDLLLFGALFHDLGKIWELEIQKNGQISYTYKGQLLGHMYLSCEFIEQKCSKILGFPDDLKVILKHIVLSHHGKMEYGSPKVPMFAEAYVVAAIDDFDSKMNQIFNFTQSERQGADSWSRFNEHFERYFYLEDLKGKWL